MSFNNDLNKVRIIFISTLFILLLLPSLLLSQISLTVGDVSGHIGEKLIPLDVRISNLVDTIAGFQIWLKLNDFEIMKFQEGDVALKYLYDTSNFIMPSWSVHTTSLSGLGADLLITSGSSVINPSYIIPPQNDELLIRLYLEVADTLTFPPVDSVVNIMLDTDPFFNFSFYTPDGRTIGLNLVEYIDTTCYECLQWVGSICGSWQKVPHVLGEPIDLSRCDSMDISLDTTVVLDSTYFQITDGSFTLLPTCGYSLDLYDISNLVALVDFMFLDGPALTLAEADFDCNCEIDISDLVGFVDFMFTGGPAPECATQ